MNPSVAGSRRIVLVPGVLALLPEYAGIEDPVAGLRRAAQAAVQWLVDASSVEQPIRIVAANPGAARVAGHLLATSRMEGNFPASTSADSGHLLVVGNGSAARTEKAPGHLHPEAVVFDDRLDTLLRAADAEGLAALDTILATELWADVGAVVQAAPAFAGAKLVAVDYAENPYGVCYRVMRWEAEQS